MLSQKENFVFAVLRETAWNGNNHKNLCTNYGGLYRGMTVVTMHTSYMYLRSPIKV